MRIPTLIAHFRTESLVDSGWWNVIAALTGVLSLAAIAITILEILNRRRQYQSTHWFVDSFGTSTGLLDSKTVELFEFTPSGVEDVHLSFIAFVGCEYVPSKDYRIRWSVKSGKAMKLALVSDGIENAWVALAWQRLTDKRFVYVRWYPLIGGGRLSDALDEQMSAHSLPKPWAFWRKTFVAPVGPGDANTWYQRVKTDAIKHDQEVLVSIFDFAINSGGTVQMAGRQVAPPIATDTPH
ncbi:hypothetical protein E3O55_08420 [Cryobacterium sp. MDB1-18-2]|uniref:hypothetical protein n=1 Tax=unclassified Cryobacterium TaxID=2649013 RepID=UPI001069A090|nr:MULTISPECIES: hypothetical protein [unclassified Cryobacterium]TFC30100.1 hypothetical protein E3O55_08420 [Cryobacterium sp. MDB1-18-2]TFC41380.1 hypothetical protein E3O50_09860 [Cryobacterium sp. MDB1-18-1]